MFPSARDSLVPSLREFLIRSGVDTPLADANSRAAQILSWAVEGSAPPDHKPPPQLAEQAEFVRSLQATAESVQRLVTTREGQFWAQMLRSVSAQMGHSYYWGQWVPADDGPIRDRQMGENLVWLANTYYRGHKIIVRVATGHSMRNQRGPVVDGLRGFHMGQRVWEVLSSESFVIGMTSYTGVNACITCSGGMEDRVQNIVADQDLSFEFEELMHAAGYVFGFVNLRRAREAGQWLGGTFAARPNFQS